MDEYSPLVQRRSTWNFRRSGALVLSFMAVTTVVKQQRSSILMQLAAGSPSVIDELLQCTTTSTDAPAVGGVDVVAFWSMQPFAQPLLGSPDFAHTVGLTTYWFSSAENLEDFAAAPKKYMPKYGGFCAWSVAEEYWKGDFGWPVGDFMSPGGWRIVDDELYFFLGFRAAYVFGLDLPENAT